MDPTYPNTSEKQEKHTFHEYITTLTEQIDQIFPHHPTPQTQNEHHQLIAKVNSRRIPQYDMLILRLNDGALIFTIKTGRITRRYTAGTMVSITEEGGLSVQDVILTETSELYTKRTGEFVQVYYEANENIITYIMEDENATIDLLTPETEPILVSEFMRLDQL